MKGNNLTSALILAITSIIWGSSFILMKKGLISYSYMEVAAIRIFISFLVLLPFAIKGMKKLKKKDLKYILIFTILNGGIPPFLFTKAQTVVDSSLAGILNALTPLFTLILGYLFFHSYLGRERVTGVIIGFVGATMLIIFRDAPGGFNLANPSNLYGLFIVLATMMYGYSTHILKTHLQNIRSLTIISTGYLMIGPFLGIYLLTTDVVRITVSDPVAWQSLGYISILAIFGTAIALILFGKLVQISNPLFSSFVTYLIPFVAIFWGILDGETLNMMQIIGMFGILTGIFIANLKAYKNYLPAFRG